MSVERMTVERVEHSADGKTVTLHMRTESGNSVIYSAPAGTLVTRIVEDTP